MKKVLTLIAVIIFCNASLKAQDDPNVGFYVDGVKVTELTCYNFKTLTVVFPWNSNFGSYNDYNISCYVNVPKIDGLWVGSENVFSKAVLTSSKLKGKYVVCEIFSENSKTINSKYSGQSEIIRRGWLSYFNGKADKDAGIFVVGFYGLTVTSVREEFDSDCNCLKKYPVYHNELLGTELKISLKNRKSVSVFKEPKVMDPDGQCVASGTKVDFNSLGGKSSSGNSNTKTPADKKATKEDDDDKEDDKD